MAKDLLPIIDSNGQFSRRRRTWVEKHEGLGTCARNAQGVYVFQCYSTEPCNTLSVEAPAPKRARFQVVLRVNEPEPSSGGAPFLPYPMAHRGSNGRRGLRAAYPVLAQPGAGL